MATEFSKENDACVFSEGSSLAEVETYFCNCFDISDDEDGWEEKLAKELLSVVESPTFHIRKFLDENSASYRDLIKLSVVLDERHWDTKRLRPLIHRHKLLKPMLSYEGMLLPEFASNKNLYERTMALNYFDIECDKCGNFDCTKLWKELLKAIRSKNLICEMAEMMQITPWTIIMDAVDLNPSYWDSVGGVALSRTIMKDCY